MASWMNFKYLLPGCWFFLLLQACGPSTPEFTITPAVVPNPNEAAPLVAYIEFASDEPTRAIIEISGGRRPRKLEPQGLFTQNHSIPVFELRPGVEYQFVVTLKDTKNNLSEPARVVTYTPPSLPADFPALETHLAKVEKREPGFTLFSVVVKEDKPVDRANPGLLVAVDQSGEVAWYFRHSRELGTLKRCRTGHILTMSEAGYVLEIDWLGNIVREFLPADYSGATGGSENAKVAGDYAFHGDIEATPGRTYLAFSSEPYEWPAEGGVEKVQSEVLVEFDRQGEVLKTWKILDYFDPHRMRSPASLEAKDRANDSKKTWKAFNSVVTDEKTGAIYIASTQQDLVAKIDPETDQLKWIFGDSTGWGTPWEKYLIKPSATTDWPHRIQSVRFSAHKSLLLIDQGAGPSVVPGLPYSRIIEYVLTDWQKSVRQTWIYGNVEEERFLTGKNSAAERMPFTGNILLSGENFVADPALGPHSTQGLIREITHKKQRDLVFEMTIDPGFMLNGILHVHDIKIKK